MKSILGVVAVTIAIASTTSIADSLTLGDLLRRDRFYEVSLSPDGKHIAYVRWEADKLEYFFRVMKLEDKAVILEMNLGGAGANSIDWLDNKNVIANDGSVFQIPIGGLTPTPLLTGILNEDKRRFGSSVFQEKFDGFWYEGHLPGDEEHILVGSHNRKRYARIHKVNVYTGVFTDIVDGNKAKVKTWVLNNVGQPVIGVREKAGEHTYMIRVDGKWKAHDDVHEGGEIQLNHSSHPRNGSARLIAALDNDRDVLVSIKDNAGRYASVVVYDVIAGVVKNTFHEDDRYSLRLSENALTVIRDERSRLPIALNYAAHDYTSFVAEPNMRVAQELAQAAYPGLPVQALSGVATVNRWLFRVLDATHGNTFVLVDPDAEVPVTELFNERSRRAKAQMPELEVLKINARDDVALDAYLWTPPSDVDHLAPVIVAQHAPLGRHYAWFDPDILYLAGQGHPVLQINPRGVSGYGEAKRVTGLSDGQRQLLNDIEDAAAWIRKHTESNDLFAFGMNMGGLAIYSLAIESPELFNAIAIYGAPLDLKALDERYALAEAPASRDYLRLMVADEKKQLKAMGLMSPMQTIETLQTPTFMVYAERNAVIPYEEFDDFVSIADRKEVPLQHRTIPYRLTGMQDPAVREQYLDLILRFFRRNSS